MLTNKYKIKYRKDFPHLLTSLGLVGAGIEVGVWKGEYSAQILSDWAGMLFSVDQWEYDDNIDNGLPSGFVSSQSDMTIVYEEAKRNLHHFGSRSEIIKLSSEEACSKAGDGFYDFVYIDASHAYEHALNDIMRWYPKVKNGGFICGHDYKNDGPNFGVKRAVDELAEKFGWEVSKTTYERKWPSWFVRLE